MNAKEAPSRAADRFLVRMPDGLRSWIAEEAKRNYRSANAQTVWMLERMREQIEAQAARAA